MKRVLLVTDGRSNQYRHLTIPKANALKKDGVQIFVIAVGNKIWGIDEMVKVAGGFSPFGFSLSPKMCLFRVKTYNDLVKVAKLVVKQVSPRKYSVIKGQNTAPCTRYG